MGDETHSFNLLSEERCEKPRLAIRNNNTIYYLPLNTGTPPTDAVLFFIKQATTAYYAIEGVTNHLYPANNIFPAEDLFPE